MIGKTPSLKSIGTFILTLFFLMTHFVFPGFPLQAQFSGDIDITFTAAQEELTVGDPVELTLSVTHPAGYQVVVPQLPQLWGDYEVRSQGDLVTVANDDGTETTSQAIMVTLFALGTYQTPSLTLSLRDNDGQLLERVVPQLSLTVTPVLDPEDNTLRDIKPQAALSTVLPWLSIIGSLVLALVLALLGWWLYKRLKSRLAAASDPLITPRFIDPRPAYQIANEELDRIERMDLPGQGRFKEYYSLVTDCLRYYLEGTYAVPAIDLTTAETRRALQQTQLNAEHVKQFITLFSEGDLVKFARFVPLTEDAYRITGWARQLVDETKIIEVAEPEDGAVEPDLETEPITPEVV